MTIANLNFFLVVNLIIFLIGFSGLLINRRNILITIMSIELMLLAVNLNLILFSVYLDDIAGQLFVLFVLTVAATESAIGLAILVVCHKVQGTIFVDRTITLKR